MWIPLKQKPGIGTILNALIIAGMIDLCINFVPSPESYTSQIILAIVAVLTVGIGGGIYLVANLGPGPRDGLMIGLQKVSNLPIATVRAFIEISCFLWMVFRRYSWNWNITIRIWNRTCGSIRSLFSR